MTLPRILTAIVGIPMVIYLVHLGSIPFLVFVLGVVALSLYEYGTVLEMGRKGVQKQTVLWGGVLVCAAISLGSPNWNRHIPSNMASFVLTAVVAAVVLGEIFRKDRSLERAGLTLFGIVFVGWGLGHLYLMRDLRPLGERLTFLVIITVWVADTASYFAGSSWGRARLAPALSPKKTWVGSVAGLAAAVATAYVFHAAVTWGHAWREVSFLPLSGCLAVGALTGVVGQISDLAESLVKRSAGVKDSAYLLPGHGGVLDRFDSFLLASPAVYYAVVMWQVP